MKDNLATYAIYQAKKRYAFIYRISTLSSIFQPPLRAMSRRADSRAESLLRYANVSYTYCCMQVHVRECICTPGVVHRLDCIMFMLFTTQSDLRKYVTGSNCEGRCGEGVVFSAWGFYRRWFFHGQDFTVRGRVHLVGILSDRPVGTRGDTCRTRERTKRRW
jgi:hypothetical protein